MTSASPGAGAKRRRILHQGLLSTSRPFLFSASVYAWKYQPVNDTLDVFVKLLYVTADNAAVVVP